MAGNGEEVAAAPEPDNATKVDQEASFAANGEEAATAPGSGDASNTDQEAPDNSNAAATMEKVEGFSTRYLNEKWIGRYDDTGQYMEYHNNQWRPLPEDDLMFIQQLWLEQEAAETQQLKSGKELTKKSMKILSPAIKPITVFNMTTVSCFALY
ncbi:hypothetical protein ANCCAN_20484 [Ancylostoma caninum]|uniref:Uncharacterized protein n=1 Tax=Ancylostoma caninum TaxID=29170 RepID=A0A368FTV7_ANCCA|nr:hypothetical protein ANCCAN_20484 [Ancylostoma caninum]